MSELAQRSGLPVPTIKYYLREGLLPAGEAVGATRARYDDSHVRRLRLVRALTDVAGMRLEDVRRVLAAIDDPTLSRHEAIGSAHTRLAPLVTHSGNTAQQVRVEELLDRHGWELDEHSAHREALAGALAALADLGHPPTDELLDVYADAAELISERDVSSLDETDRAEATEHAVVSTLLLEPVLLTLRRIAQENSSRRRSR
ncbi:MAG: MerR family transcriptional regulator [Marmoricola sp.]